MELQTYNLPIVGAIQFFNAHNINLPLKRPAFRNGVRVQLSMRSQIPELTST